MAIHQRLQTFLAEATAVILTAAVVCLVVGAASPALVCAGGTSLSAANPIASVNSGPVRRIKFAPGATEATVEGRLHGQKDVANFVVRVRAGQHMYVHVESDQLNNPQIDVIFPSGEHMDRDMQGTQFRTDATQAGDYRIKVYEGYKGDPSDGAFALKIKVE
jgi:hypothetical protein